MAGTHGDLFREIGELVVAAHRGATIDLQARSEELARRYINLGVPAETISRAIARSVGAVGVSLARVGPHQQSARPNANPGEPEEEGSSPVVSGLFPSGVRIAVLS
jgi:hypothetical protein